MQSLLCAGVEIWATPALKNESQMKTTITQTKDFEFMEGAKVHYGNSDTWLALCGSGWLNASDDPSEVTCMECLSLLEQRERPAPPLGEK